MQEQPRVMVPVALAGPGLEQYTNKIVAWWRCYAEKHGYRFFLDHELGEGDLVTLLDLSRLFESDRTTPISGSNCFQPSATWTKPTGLS